jgi:tetratricopeptide (TPR) repeat protein
MSHSKKKYSKEKNVSQSNQSNQLNHSSQPNKQEPQNTAFEVKASEIKTSKTSNEIISQKFSKILLPFLTFSLSLAVYFLTFARTVTLVDSGELILASAKLGVAHPPGFPLYTVLGHLFSKLPLGTVAAKISFMSAFFAALTGAFLTLIAINIYDTFTQISPTSNNKQSSSKQNNSSDSLSFNLLPLSSIFQILMPLATGLSFSFSATFWFYASVAEVYTLNIFVLSIIFYLMLEWHLLRQKGEFQKADKIIPVAALLYGLALGNHHITILLTLPAIACLVIYNAGFRYLYSRTVKIAFITVLIGFSIYVYLPLAASQSPIINWGDPATLEKFYWHISAKQYRVNLSLESETMIKELKYFLKILLGQFTPLGLITALVGLEKLWRSQRSLFYLTSLTIFFNVFYSISYEIAEDKDAYYLTTNFVLAIAIGVGLISIFEMFATKGKVYALGIFLILFSLPSLNFASHYFQNNKRNYMIAKDFVENTLLSVEPNGLLLTLDWQFYSPYLYMRHLEGFRRDAIVVDINLLRRSWYVDYYLKQEYPEMMQACSKEVSDFMKDLKLFEEDKPYDVSNINKNFTSLINAFIKYNLTRNSVHITLPIDPPDIGKEYNWVPQGLTMRFYTDQSFRPEFSSKLELRGLFDGSVYLDEVAKEKVIPAYALMLTNRAKYLSLGQRYDESIELLQLSLKLKPDFDRAYQFLGDVYLGKGNRAEAEFNYTFALQINPSNQAAKAALEKLRQAQQP